MKFVAPNAVPMMKRNFNAALDRIFFFDDQTPESDLAFDTWNQLVTKARAGSYTFEGNAWRTGQVQGQANSTQYYPANLGALLEGTLGSSYSTASSPQPPTIFNGDMWNFLTLDLDAQNYQATPLCVNPKKPCGFGANGFSAPDTRMLFAMKPMAIATAVSAKLTAPFSKANTYLETGGGYVNWWIKNSAICSTTTIRPITTGSGGSRTAIADNWANVTDPSFAQQTVNANALGQLMVIEPTEFRFQQWINAAGSGAQTPSYYNMYGFNNLTVGGKRDDTTFTESAMRGMYYPIAGTPETPRISWGALLVRWGMEKVFLKLNSTDIVAKTVTPGTSAQIVAQAGITPPLSNQQIFAF
ncbi:hypothetical protein JA33_098 [Dickeya phage vB_DsoM_JA33]|uniref:Uncharacterized protein n=3 Tax=Salmondvirus JA11 TaxID=2734141 RepID=A0A384ZW92_9CAUD|nr:hypothetical protein HOU32_gp098 [Dickeya phage vB_DsoM_JA11]AXG66502.1 hypothetical protein JA13_099 [Dickeya phage vB_DsoM_JA13]AXG67472.1 hypothetical protein JA33_098 [Dickeya phage vB_DsoM_JA33]AYD79903.1 hypothetical protein JA11_098 [Dickeya phage vB_DsoM_JA11]